METGSTAGITAQNRLDALVVDGGQVLELPRRSIVFGLTTDVATRTLTMTYHPATKRRGADPTVPAKPASQRLTDKTERALDQGLEELMAGSDAPSITQPGKNFVGPND